MVPQPRHDLKAARTKKTGCHRIGRRRVRVRRAPTNWHRRRHRVPSAAPLHPVRRCGPLDFRLFFLCGSPRCGTRHGLPSCRASSCPCGASSFSFGGRCCRRCLRRKDPCLSFSVPSLPPALPSASAWPPAVLSSPLPIRLVLLRHRRCHRRLMQIPVSII